MRRAIVGLTGPTAGGKGTVAGFLKEVGYTYFSLSDELRKEAAKRNWGGGKETLQNLGDELREKFGNAVLAKRVAELDEFKNAQRIIIDSIRNPAEINYLRDFFGAKILGVTASVHTRYEYYKERAREGDPMSFQEFLRLDGREMINGNGGSTHVIQIKECLRISDFVIVNEVSKERLRELTEYAFFKMGLEIPRLRKEREV